jgi:hypothetical protein
VVAAMRRAVAATSNRAKWCGRYIAMRVKFGAQDLHIGYAVSSERSKDVANKYVLDTALAETRMRGVMIFGRHDASGGHE